MPAPVVLVTGFEPFGGDVVNPSWLVARALHGRQIASARVRAVELPCVFGRARDVMAQALGRWQPALVLALGQAGGRAELSIERVAINLDDATLPDNAGAQPVDRTAVPGGPAAYFSTLPVRAMAAAVAAAGIPVGISQSAGTFVCNHVFYGLQHALVGRPVRSGFMHLPLLPEQAALHPGEPALPLDTLCRGTRIALAAALRQHPIERRQSGGART